MLIELNFFGCSRLHLQEFMGMQLGHCGSSEEDFLLQQNKARKAEEEKGHLQ